jgi:hypothetical protein
MMMMMIMMVDGDDDYTCKNQPALAISGNTHFV